MVRNIAVRCANSLQATSVLSTIPSIRSMSSTRQQPINEITKDETRSAKLAGSEPSRLERLIGKSLAIIGPVSVSYTHAFLISDATGSEQDLVAWVVAYL